MHTTKKYSLSFLCLGIAFLSGCDQITSHKPTEKEVIAALKMSKGMSYGNSLPDKLCISLPKGSVNSILNVSGQPSWTALVSGSTSDSANALLYGRVDNVKKFDALVSAGLLKKEDYKVYQNQTLTDGTKYSVTAKGAAFLASSPSDWTGGQKCFKAADVSTQKLIPGVNEAGEKLSELIVENKGALEAMKNGPVLKSTVYKAWVSSEVSGVADWAKNPDVQSTFSSELAIIEKPKAVPIDVVYYADMWMPFELAMRLNAQALGTASQEMPEEMKKRFTAALENYKKEYDKLVEKENTPPTLSPEVTAQILKQAEASIKNGSSPYEHAGISGRMSTSIMLPLTETETPATVKAANAVFFSYDQAEMLPVGQGQPSLAQLQADLEKLSKVSPDLAKSSVGTELRRKIDAAKALQDQRLNKRKETLEFLDLLVEQGLAKKTELKKGQQSTHAALAGKEGALYELDGSIVKSSQYGNSGLALTLYDIKLTDVKRIKTSFNEEKQKFVLSVGAKAVATEKTKGLFEARPELIATGNEVTVVVQFTGNPSEPYKVVSIN